MQKFDWKDENNYSLLADFYEFTMANGYLDSGIAENIAYFDLYFREIPDGAGFAISSGLEQAIEYIKRLSFTKEDIEYFKSKEMFSQKFLDYLKNFKFECDLWAMPEGSIIFPNEPILTVRGPVIQAQMMETMLLVTMNFQSMIATKANRIVRAADGRKVLEFGSRRAHGYNSAILGARAAYIGGCVGSANTLTDRLYGVPALGTMAHSWIQMFDSEIDAFRAYAKAYPHNCNLLIDTYDVLNEGLPNAIKIFNEEVLPKGFRPTGVRIDSGDLSYLSKKVRQGLDEAGFEDCPIVLSGGLDEYTIGSLLKQGAKVDSFGVGERLITSKSDPIFGCVYKLVATEDENGKILPKIKISENIIKITTPGFKQVYRFFDKETDAPIADVLMLRDEKFEVKDNYEIFHPLHTWKRKTLKNYYYKKMLVPIFEKGELVYDMPSLEEIREYALSNVEKLWPESKRFENPHVYFVDYSQKLWDLKNKLLNEHDF
ncbi:MAG: nicotinate phosphoribosyltransferase [Tissierellia bacterium]|nr:nicotinate phosphoribosyltransferase [Tissierellia bacterium]